MGGLDGYGGEPSGCEGRNRVIFTAARCQTAAERLTAYWKNNPDRDILAVRYDALACAFIFTHRENGEFAMTPECFFAAVAERYVLSVVEEVKRALSRFSEK